MPDTKPLRYAKSLLDQEIRPVMPYTRPRTKDGFFKKYEYVYDEHYDCYICPNNQILEYRTTTREGYRQYASNPEICKTCPFLEKCTQSKDHTKLIHRHIWEHYVEEADHLRHTEINKNIYESAKKRLNESLPMEKRSMACDGQPFGDWRNCPCRRCLLLLP